MYIINKQKCTVHVHGAYNYWSAMKMCGRIPMQSTFSQQCKRLSLTVSELQNMFICLALTQSVVFLCKLLTNSAGENCKHLVET